VRNQTVMEAGVGIEPAYVELQSLPARAAFPILLNSLTSFSGRLNQAFSDSRSLYKTVTYIGVCAVFKPLPSAVAGAIPLCHFR
jgi:hypothetical protein